MARCWKAICVGAWVRGPAVGEPQGDDDGGETVAGAGCDGGQLGALCGLSGCAEFRSGECLG